jgi:hypothetical protein
MYIGQHIIKDTEPCLAGFDSSLKQKLKIKMVKYISYTQIQIFRHLHTMGWREEALMI